jgi:Ca2+-binding EF-hand superfamily protein
MHTRFVAILIAAVTMVLTANVMAAEGKAGEQAKGGMTPEKKAAILKEFDKNGDGELCEAEKKAMMQARKQKMDELVKQFDKDGDGKLNEEEKKAMMEARKQRGKGEGPKGRNAKKEGKGKE